MKVLILGKMDNINPFNCAEIPVRNDGNIPINPMSVMYALPAEISNADFIAVLIELVRISDAVMLLPGWEHDLGASIAKRNAENAEKIILKGECYS